MANPKMQKHVSLINITRTTTTGSYTFTGDRNVIYYYDADVYDQVTAIYFEADIQISDATGTMYAILSKVSDNTDVTGSEISIAGGTSTSMTRVRSGDIKANLTDNTDYRVRWKRTTAGTGTLNAARLIIVQDGAVTKTETIIEMGEDNNVTASYAETPLSSRFYRFLFESARFNGTVNAYLEADLHCNASGDTTYAQLYDVTAGAAVASSEVTHTGDTTTTRKRSGAITLTDGHEYRTDVKGSSTSDDVASVKLIIQQSGTPTKTDCYVNICNTNSNGTDTSYTAQQRYVDYSNTDWSGDTVEEYFETTLSNLGNGVVTYCDLYNVTDSTEIVELSQNVNPGGTLYRLRSAALTMPGDTGNTLDNRRKTASSTALIGGSFLIIQVDWSTAGGTVVKDLISSGMIAFPR